MADAPRALIVAGPTCSGKSALALALAEAVGGTVINADSMQVYRELPIVTAQPGPEDQRRAPHRLYGVRPAAESGSAAWWREAALAEMAAARAAGRLPILCGGTGLYFLSLTAGLSDIPDPGPEARREARDLLAAGGPAALHARLAVTDPATAARLRPSDGQRIARAWEVWRGTGRGMAAWHAAAGPDSGPASGWAFRAILLDPPRDALRAAIAGRFDAMIAAGAIEEVRTLLALKLDPSLPAMRAHGVPDLAEYLAGTLSLPAAVRRATLASGQYTKRQATWFRGHALADPAATHTIHARITDHTQFSQREWCDLLNFVQGPG